MDTPGDDPPRQPELAGYDVLGLLGSGATGTVWSVRGPDEVRLAAKVLTEDAEHLDYELSVLQAIRHEHVIRLHDVVLDRSTDPHGTAMIMELAEGGSLTDTLRRREVLTAGELVTVLCPVARALHDLHGMGLVHGDLSPGNILLTADGKPLIADLGMSRLAGHAGDEVWATEAWAAPEVLAGGRPVPASDVYSLGAIAWRALTGAPPEPAALRPDLAELAPSISDELRDLVNAALAHTESARPLPGEFAIALWRCAPPEPAPVQGSPARRTAVAVQDAPEADALTRRIRAQAAADATSAAGEDAQQRPRVPVRMRWMIAAAGVAGVAISWAATGFGSGSASGEARAAGTLVPASSAPSQVTHRPGERSSAAHTASSPSTSPVSHAAELGTRPVRVLQRLATARAAAWRSGDRTRLVTAEVEGSPAYRSDSADLRTAAAAKLRYHGLKFTVRSAEVRQGKGEVVHVSAVIDGSSYAVVGPRGKRRVPAAPGQRTDLSMQWTEHGWRVVDWAAPG